MKLFKALVGLAAAASVIPLKVEKTEDGGKKTVRISSLTWKAEYTSASENDDATLNIDLMGGLKDLIDRKEKNESEEEDLTDPIDECENDFDFDETEDWLEDVVENITDTVDDEKSILDRITDVLDDADDLFMDTVEFAVEFGKMSTSMLQRKFRIGYGRAAKIIDAMTNCGIVSFPNGSKPRDVLISADEWKEIKEQISLSKAEDAADPETVTEPLTETETE